MSRRARIRRQWTHRRLGLGAAHPVDVESLRTESLLAAVGARRAGFSADAFDAALLDFVCDVDLTVGLPALEATPLPLAELRAAMPATRRRVTWRVLVPTMTTGVAVVAVLVTAMLLGPSTPTSPALTATAESNQLLTHADTLLTAARHATAPDRAKLLTEAKADLNHVSRLLPLTAPQSRPEIRERLEALGERAEPLTAKPSRAAASDAEDATGTESSGVLGPSHGAGRSSITEAGAATPPEQPVHRRSERRHGAQQPGSGEGVRADASTSGGEAAWREPTTSQPAPVPPTSDTRHPPLDGTAQDTTPQQPPPGAEPLPRR
jgi:hypothetical protein